MGGIEYPVLLSSALGLDDAKRVQKLGTRFYAIGQRIQEVGTEFDTIEELETAQEKQEEGVDSMKEALEEFLDIIVPSIPTKIRQDPKFTDDKKMAILSFFGEAMAMQRAFLRDRLANSSPRSRTGSALAQGSR